MRKRAAERSTRGDLAAALLAHLHEADLPAGAPLTERAMADALGVSRTPVRRALSALADRGVVESRRHRGYTLRRPSLELFPPAIELPAYDADALFDRIVRDHLAGELDEVFSAETVAARYEVSRRRAQEALSLLRSEGALTAGPQGEHRFADALTTMEASDASYTLRIILEPQLLRLPRFAMSEETLRSVRMDHVTLLGMSPAARASRIAYRLDAAFHDALAEACGNPLIADVVAQQNRLRQLMEYRDYARAERLTAWCHEHIAILDALADGAPHRAADLMHNHLVHAMASRTAQ